MNKKNESFESNLEDLETLVHQLDEGELSLEESLEKFEKGVELYKKCKKALNKVELKIKKLSDSLEEVDY